MYQSGTDAPTSERSNSKRSDLDGGVDHVGSKSRRGREALVEQKAHVGLRRSESSLELQGVVDRLHGEERVEALDRLDVEAALRMQRMQGAARNAGVDDARLTTDNPRRD